MKSLHDNGRAAVSRVMAAQRGVTLVELVISIVVISVALTGVLSAIVYANRFSAEPMIRQQAIELAQSKLEEVLLRSFLETGNGDSCPPNDGDFDNVCDFDGAVETPAAPLDDYTVSVTVDDTDTLGVGGTQLQGAGDEVLRVDVTVTHDSGASITISGYRTNY